jgi:perosamine synthetase
MSKATQPESVRKIAGARPLFADEDMPEILNRFANVLRGGRLIFGDNTREFEASFRDYVGVTEAVSVSSCTAALEIALRYYDVRDREVIVPTNTFVSVVKAIMYAGAVPVLAEMDPATFCLDTEDTISRINDRTAGVIVVHIAGLVYPDMDRLRAVCKEKGLFLIEDPSHAHGAQLDGRKAGGLADAACFSFYPTKVMTTGTGGMITTDDAGLARYARSLRHHGQGESLENITNLGNDWCMNEVEALLGVYQLKRLEENVRHRNRVVEWYRSAFERLDWVEAPALPPNVRHAYYKFPVLLEEGIDKGMLRRVMMEEFEIEMGAVYDPPCHLQQVFQERLGCREGMFPKAERALRRQICPPVHAAVTEEDVARVVAALEQTVDRCRKA